MQNQLSIFVFVVCGGREHIDTLHFSLKALRKFSQKEIIVITDLSRNEIPIEFDRVIDTKTPEHLNHHQASIYIKTGIHKFLPKGNLYCYIDTDVVALSTDVDQIFHHFKAPITFASDHCKTTVFSPHAVNCNCFEQNKKDLEELKILEEKYSHNYTITDSTLLAKQQVLFKKFNEIKRNKLNYLFISLRFLTTWKTFKLDEDIFYNRWKKHWFDSKGEVILYDKPKDYYKLIEENSKWRWNSIRQRWISSKGDDVYELKCNHLTDYISEKFKIEVKEKNWQHWNGGVFLFDDTASDFLSAWHEKTLAIFNDPKWKTRDQGTLIASAWQYKLQKQPLLPIEFNFLADYNHPTMLYKGNLQFSFGGVKKTYSPKFAHIYHHWGDEQWEVWRDVSKLFQKSNA